MFVVEQLIDVRLAFPPMLVIFRLLTVFAQRYLDLLLVIVVATLLSNPVRVPPRPSM